MYMYRGWHYEEQTKMQITKLNIWGPMTNEVALADDVLGKPSMISFSLTDGATSNGACIHDMLMGSLCSSWMMNTPLVCHRKV